MLSIEEVQNEQIEEDQSCAFYHYVNPVTV